MSVTEPPRDRELAKAITHVAVLLYLLALVAMEGTGIINQPTAWLMAALVLFII